MTKEAFPLDWPLGYKRTQSFDRKKSKFITTADKSQKFLRDEIKRLCGKYNDPKLVISTNIPVRKDGGLYSDYMTKKLDDPGVAIYFTYKKKTVCMCCDQYLTVWENVYALGKGIEALRGMDRWGVSEFIDRAFTGFTAIEGAKPNYIIREWYDVLEVTAAATVEVIKANYRRLAMDHHPDKQNGNTDKFVELNNAYEKAKQIKNFN